MPANLIGVEFEMLNRRAVHNHFMERAMPHNHGSVGAGFIKFFARHMAVPIAVIAPSEEGGVFAGIGQFFQPAKYASWVLVAGTFSHGKSHSSAVMNCIGKITAAIDGCKCGSINPGIRILSSNCVSIVGMAVSHGFSVPMCRLPKFVRL